MPSIAKFMHEITFFNPGVVHFFVLPQLRNIAVDEKVVIGVGDGFRLANEG